MKAVVHANYGPPEVLQLAEIETPTPRDREVRIRVHATTVNRTDCGVLRAKPFFVRFFYGLRAPRNRVLGNEFAGRVDAVGSGVTQYKVGDDVIGYNDATFGAHAEYMIMPEDGMMAAMPQGMPYEEAAPIAEGAHYALKDIRKFGVAPGYQILVNGATGAIGSAAVQLLKHYGAEITAVCDTKNVDLVKSLGADHVIDYTQEDFTSRDEGFDVVYDAVGKSSFGACKRLLKSGGIYCSSDLGFLAQNPALALWTSRFGDKKVVFPIPRNSREDMVLLTELVEAGEFTPVIDRQYPIDQVSDAFRYVETGYKTGNVVIYVD